MNKKGCVECIRLNNLLSKRLNELKGLKQKIEKNPKLLLFAQTDTTARIAELEKLQKDVQNFQE